MKNYLFTLILAIISFNATSQEKAKAFFERKTDTLYSDTKKEVSQSFKIIVPKQDKLKDAKIDFSVQENDMNPTGIFLPTNKTITVGSSQDTIKKDLTVKFQRDSKDDRMLILKINASDKDGKTIDLLDSNITYKIYIKPQSLDTLKDASKTGYEFWVFTGTNLDLLDGVKLRELYFKGSYLINFKRNDTSTRSWMFLTFGKNRFFSDRDSLSRIPFSDVIPKPTPGDSITIVNGYYNSFRNTLTDNIFASIDYLYNVKNMSSDKSIFFINGGFYFGLQTLKTSSENSGIVSDTNTYLRKPDSTYTFRPLGGQSKIRQFNYNISLGFTHILSTKKINIKSHLTTGINIFNYPYSVVRSSTNEYAYYKNEKKLFFQLRIDATVLNPGISIGFETFIRKGQIPLFNVSLTKVLDIEQLSSLFSKVPTAVN
jgi:hypothetical protein